MALTELNDSPENHRNVLLARLLGITKVKKQAFNMVGSGENG